MKDKKVLAFGEVMMRLAVPDHKMLHQSRTLEYLFSGTGVNIVSALSTFGYKGELLTKLPQNSLGHSAKLFLASLGIDTDKIIFGDKYMGMYFLESGFGPRGGVVTYTDRLNSSFCKSTLDDYDFDKALCGVDLLHFCGISLAVTKNVREVVLKLMEKAKEKGITIVFDCNFRSTLWNSYEEAKPFYEEVLYNADIVFATDRDATSILGIEGVEGDKITNLKHTLSIMRERYNIKYITGTIRETINLNKHRLQGYILDEDGLHLSNKHEFDILDRIGGGDGYAAGLIYAHLEGMDVLKRVEFAIGSGVLAHSTYGDTPCARVEEVEAYIDGTMEALRR